MDRDEDWQDNDGALNTLSMTHPRFPVEHPSHFVVNDSECQPLRPGIWLVLFLLHLNSILEEKLLFCNLTWDIDNSLLLISHYYLHNIQL